MEENGQRLSSPAAHAIQDALDHRASVKNAHVPCRWKRSGAAHGWAVLAISL
jgi:hypothetical protein